LKSGDRVTVMPIFPCGECKECQGRRYHLCNNSSMLGIDRDGAFAEYVLVPSNATFKIPDDMSWMIAAYTEPVAAALGVLHAQLGERGAILGKNRFSHLVHQVLVASGIRGTRLVDDLESTDLPAPCSLDFVIETDPSPQWLAAAVDWLRPRGSLVLKSRSPASLQIPALPLVKKELRLQGVHYGPFTQALELLASGRVRLADLLGPLHRLEDFASAFQQASASEAAKHFFSIGVV
jgi:threonine dehydrogenase-like Zn-dependent dehydrogenase